MPTSNNIETAIRVMHKVANIPAWQTITVLRNLGITDLKIKNAARKARAKTTFKKILNFA